MKTKFQLKLRDQTPEYMLKRNYFIVDLYSEIILSVINNVYQNTCIPTLYCLPSSMVFCILNLMRLPEPSNPVTSPS